MSATDVLRHLLEERGVKWDESISDGHCVFTWWESPTFGRVHAMDNDDGTLFMACLNNCDFTPEQAIEATLGWDNAGRYVGLRQGKRWERTENSDYYCGGCGWKVTDHDSYCPECGGALHKVALGHSSNCTNGERTTTVDETETLYARGDTWGTKEFGKSVVVHVMECSACGHTYEHVNGDYEYCPHCRARIVHTDE